MVSVLSLTRAGGERSVELERVFFLTFQVL
jgi:predicted DNA-binding ribbon-helix-helix protein